MTAEVVAATLLIAVPIAFNLAFFEFGPALARRTWRDAALVSRRDLSRPTTIDGLCPASFDFISRGTQALEGVAEEWELFAVSS